MIPQAGEPIVDGQMGSAFNEPIGLKKEEDGTNNTKEIRMEDVPPAARPLDTAQKADLDSCMLRMKIDIGNNSMNSFILAGYSREMANIAFPIE